MFGETDFAPEILAISADRLLSFAGVVFGPAIGFLFLYILRLPLRKLPLVGETEDWHAPKWVLPTFALAGTFLTVSTFSLGVFLSALPESFDRTAVLSRFGVTRDVSLASLATLATASVTLEGYDGDSDLVIYVNGYRAFSTSDNCRMAFQCKPASTATSLQLAQLQAQRFDFGSLFHINRLYALPLEIDVINFLFPGDNVIDIISSNSGVGDCNVAMSIAFADGAAGRVSHELKIVDGASPDFRESGPAQPTEVFFSVHRSSSEAEPGVHPAFATLESNPSYRLCHRIRLQLPLTETQLAGRAAETWQGWAISRRIEEECDFRRLDAKACAERAGR